MKKTSQKSKNLSSKPLLSDIELSVVDKLGDAWNQFLKLESLHPDSITEFRHIIHAAQHIIMARPVQRQFNHNLKSN